MNSYIYNIEKIKVSKTRYKIYLLKLKSAKNYI